MKSPAAKIFWLLLAGVTLARFFSACAGGIHATEAYFWLLGGRWEWASFEGPGGLPALVALLGAFSEHSAFFLPVLSPLWVLVSSLGLWWFVRRRHEATAAMWVVAFWNCLPWNNAAGLQFSPDPLFLTLWIWFWAVSWKAAGDLHGQGLWWVLASVLSALGCLVSYAMLLAPLGIVGAVIADRLFAAKKTPRLSAACLLVPLASLAALSGPFAWNVRTGWVAFAGTTWQRFVEPGGTASVESLVSAVLAGGGLLGFVLLFAIVRRARTGVVGFPSGNVMNGWLAGAANFPAAIWFVLQVWRGEAAEIPLLLLVAGLLPLWLPAVLESHVGHRPLALRKSLAVLAGGVALVLSLPGILGGDGRAQNPDWAGIAERVERVARIYQPAGEDPVFLIAGSPEIASGTGFYLLHRDTGRFHDFPPMYLRESQNLASQFGLWPRYDEFLESAKGAGDAFFQEQKGVNPYLGRSALYLGEEKPSDLPQTIENGFERVLPLEVLYLPDGGALYLYFCEDYQTAPL